MLGNASIQATAPSLKSQMVVGGIDKSRHQRRLEDRVNCMFASCHTSLYQEFCQTPWDHNRWWHHHSFCLLSLFWTYRKSGMPAATETPAPDNTMIFFALPDWIQSTKLRISKSPPNCKSASSNVSPSSGLTRLLISLMILDISPLPILLLSLLITADDVRLQFLLLRTKEVTARFKIMVSWACPCNVSKVDSLDQTEILL